MTGCTISVILFVAAMNLMVKSVEKTKWGAVLSNGIQQVPIRAFMDDLTITARSVAEGRWILEVVEITKCVCRTTVVLRSVKMSFLLSRKNQ